MPNELEFDCDGDECVWQWNANAYPVDRIDIRVRRPDGGMEIRTVPNTGRLTLPATLEIDEIVSTGEGGRTRAERWRGPG